MWVENKGKTLHLLKQASKPVPQQRKRKKREIFGENQPQEMINLDNLRVDSEVDNQEEQKQGEVNIDVAMHNEHRPG